MYLIFTGVVQNPFHFGWTTTRDIFGNSVKLPNISSFSLLFSSLSMFKTLIALNIVDIHIKVCFLIWRFQYASEYSYLIKKIVTYLLHFDNLLGHQQLLLDWKSDHLIAESSSLLHLIHLISNSINMALYNVLTYLVSHPNSSVLDFDANNWILQVEIN